MGDPVSPGLTIGTCAYMEDNFMRNIEEDTKQFFKAKRYLDDVLIVTADNKKWDNMEFKRQIETTCYEEPLKLTPGNENTYLDRHLLQSRTTQFDIASKTTISAHQERFGDMHWLTAIHPMRKKELRLQQRSQRFTRWRATMGCGEQARYRSSRNSRN